MTEAAILRGWIDGDACHLPDLAIHELFLMQVQRDPDAIAVRQWSSRLTYRRLESITTALAPRLRAAGVRPGCRVGICMKRTCRMPAGALAILMAGGTCVPLDLEQSPQRLKSVVEDAGIGVALVDRSGAEVLAGIVNRMVAVSSPADLHEGPSDEFKHVALHDTAFIMYTSGPAGSPKGVTISHRNVLALVSSMNQFLGDSRGYRLAASAASGSPVSLYELFAPLVCGGSVQLASEAEQADSERLQRFLQIHRATRAFLPPALLPLLDPDRLPSLREVIVGGEPCDPAQVGRWAIAGSRRFYHWYGQTETTAAVVGVELTGRWDQALPIGRTLPGSSIYILDKDMRISPPGQAGELFVGGPQVAVGYTSNPGENAGRFVADPFSGAGPGPCDGRVLYRTGDLAMWDDSGMISFLRRADEQPGIRGQSAEQGEARATLKRQLRAAGGVGAGVLETPQPAEPAAEFERAVAQAWEALFDVSRPSPDDDFFLAGGDSLSAMRLASALSLRTGREISVEDIFIGQTVAGIAARIRSGAANEVLPTAAVPMLSLAQRRLWFVEQFVPGVPVHNVVMVEQIIGTVDVPALQRAFHLVAERQTALRWQLQADEGLPAATVANPSPIAIPIDDLSTLDAPARQSAVNVLLDEEVHNPVDLYGSALWRTRLVRLGGDEHLLVITVHHIIFDGWSQAILYRELGQAYRSQLGMPSAAMAPLAVTFGDYTAWTLDKAKRNAPADTAWWKRHLSGAPTVLDLPRDRARPAVLTFSGATSGTPIDAELAADVARLAAVEGTTVGAVLLAGFSVLLQRLTGHRDQVVGIPMADRGHADFEHLVGFFIRTLPLRLRVEDHAAFIDHVRHCTEELAEARRHADAPLERIVEAMGGSRDLTRNPLFQVMFNVYNFIEPRLDLNGAVVRPWRVDVPGSLVDLTLYVIPRDGGIRLEVVYNCDLYDQERIDAFLDSYICLLRDLVRSPARPVSTACARPGDTRLPDWTAPLSSDIPPTPGLVEQVRAAGRDSPDSVAIEESGRVLSYRDILQISGGTAAALRAAAVRTGDVVAVLAARTAVLPPVLLGVLSTGARWAIVDCETADPALDRRLAAIAPHVIIRCSRVAVSPSASCAVPVIDEADIVGTHSVPGGAADVQAARRGYLSLTSGTTGEPKAIETCEAPLAHFLNWYRATFSIGSNSRFALLGGLAHDPLLRDMFTPLACGATLAIPAADLLRDPVRLLAWLADRRITVAHLTPQLVRMMTACADSATTLRSLGLIAIAGDQLTEGDAAALHLIAPQATLLNFYGTTETPQAQAYHEIQPAERAPDGQTLAALHTMPVTVGEGIDGSQLLVMSTCGGPAAVGELGHVVIRSRYLSRGYVGQSPNVEPYAPLPGAGEGRVFRTGDLGRYGPSGTVTLAGRADDQVKVRGFRVELGWVEGVLCSHPDVERAAVRLVEDGGVSSLHAYVVSGAGDIAESELFPFLRSQLPPYATPSGITVLDTLPLTPAGKVNRDALPSPTQARTRVALNALHNTPNGNLERLVLGIWQEVLGRSQFAVSDNFFEVGGNSMAIIEVQARLRQALDCLVPVVDLFRFPTVRSLAKHLAGGHTDTRLLASDLRGSRRRRRSGRRTPIIEQEN